MNRAMLVGMAAACAALGGTAAAAVRTQPIDYRQGGAVLQGFLAYDDAATGKRPGVLVVHEWWGHNEHARNQARKLAEAGYVAFALDMYGKGKVTTHPAEAKTFMAEVTKDKEVLDARFQAGLEVLKRQPQVDRDRTAVFGYCFGGTVALSEARAGADLNALVAFHAGLAPMGARAEKGKVKPRILVQTGGADPNVPREQVQAFEEEMKAANASVEVITYPGAKHGFTNPDADKAGVPGLGYDPEVTRRSWDAAIAFLREVFGG